MAIVVRVHFDGKVIIPEEPVDLPINQSVEAEFRVPDERLSPKEIAKRRAAWKRFTARAAKWPDIPVEELRRENMYEPPRGL